MHEPLTKDQLHRDGRLIGLPSGRKVSVFGVRDFDPSFVDDRGRCPIHYQDGRVIYLSTPENISAFNAALNTICVFQDGANVAGADMDNDGRRSES